MLDVLRGIAVVLVLLRHMTPCSPAISTFWSHVSSVLVRGGWIGVDIFFVLSGFLVSGLLFREYLRRGTIGAWRFFLRRQFKIYPAFAFFVLVMLGAGLYKGEIPGRMQALNELLFLQNYRGGLHVHTWSLDVEEHFYLMLLALFVCLVRYGPRQGDCFRLLPFIFVLFFVSLLMFRCGNAILLPFSYKTHVFASHLRIDSLFVGVMISYYYHFFYRTVAATAKIRDVLLVVGIVFLLPAFAYQLESTPWLSAVGFTLLSVGSGCLLLACLDQKPDCERSKNPAFRMLAFLGVYSYSIYLWHIAVSLGVRHLLGNAGEFRAWLLCTSAYLAVSVALGVIMAKLVEMPLLRIRDRLLPSGF